MGYIRAPPVLASPAHYDAFLRFACACVKSRTARYDFLRLASVQPFYAAGLNVCCWEALREELKHSPSLATLEVRADRKYKTARALITRSAHRAGALSTRTGAPWPCSQDCVRAGGARARPRALSAERLRGGGGGAAAAQPAGGATRELRAGGLASPSVWAPAASLPDAPAWAP